MRTTERDDWRKVKAKLDCFKDLSDEALTKIQTAAKGMQDAGVLRHARAEDLGMDEDDVRRSPFWFWFIAPIALIGGITSLPLARWIEIFAKNESKTPVLSARPSILRDVSVPRLLDIYFRSIGLFGSRRSHAYCGVNGLCFSSHWKPHCRLVVRLVP